MIQVKAADVSRKDGAILISLALDAPSGIGERSAVLMFWQDAGQWHAVVRDRDAVDADAGLTLPPLAEGVGQWLCEIPRFSEADRVEQETREVGQRYALIAEVVERQVVHGYAAKVLKIARRVP